MGEPMETTGNVKWRRYWDKHSNSYDAQMRFWDRVLFKDSRTWTCSRAIGNILEVAVGTGLNLPYYPAEARITGIDFSPAMLEIARRRSSELDRTVELRDADAHALPFPDDSFDTVVCTFSLCAIPDEHRAIREMKRVLRPGGRLLLADHIGSRLWPLWAAQWLLERMTIPLQGEHFLRRPLEVVQAEGFEVLEQERFGTGIVERIAARKP
jgi:ubiquinone/menaquinone biosynthesis C-methylase UbiE